MKTKAQPAPLEAFPTEVLVHICELAGPRAAARLSAVSHECDRMVSDPELWRQWYVKYVGPVPVTSDQGMRGAFARDAALGSRNLAAAADLGDFNVVGVSLIAMPHNDDAMFPLRRALEARAAGAGRPVRCITTTRLHTDEDFAALDPQLEVCVFYDVDAASPAQAARLARWIGSRAQMPNCAIVVVHAGEMDTCDGALLRQAKLKKTYHPEPYEKFPLDPVARARLPVRV